MSSAEAKGRILWLWNRLRCMSPAEVLHRIHAASRKLAARLLGRRQRWLEDPDAAPTADRWLRVPAELMSNQATACAAVSGIIAAEAERISTGKVHLFDAGVYAVGRIPDWNRCPLTGVRAARVHSDAISLTDRSQVGDIKFVWELNRHLHWVTLAQAHALGCGTQPLAVLGDQLRAWLRQCPPHTGPNWTSPLEYALRLVNWSAVWQLIDGDRCSLFSGAEGQALLHDWLDSVQHHVLGIAERYSRHSSANNHLIGELAGVFVAAQTWPCWPRVRALGERARQELEQQIALQTTEDGVNREQAFEYAAFAFDFFAVVERCAATAGQPMSPAYLDRMAAMCCFVRSVMDAGGHVPQVGDADGARVLRLHPGDSHEVFAAMLQKGARLFGRPDWLAGLDGQGEHEAQWLYAGLEQPVARTARQPALSFPEGGYELFEANPGTPNEVKGLVDVGPLGYLGIAAHGHADALQVCLSLGGHPVLVDPGTYSYWCEKPWRDYFRGTAAHNTVRIGQQDQSQSGGRFMWTRKAQVSELRVRREPDGAMRLSASHDGYKRLASRFIHQRTVAFAPDAHRLDVKDRVSGRQHEQIELHWHIHPDWTAALDGSVLTLSLGAHELQLELTRSAGSVTNERLDLLQGQDGLPLGWYSSSYHRKQPGLVMRWSGMGSDVELHTVIRWRTSSKPAAPARDGMQQSMPLR